MQILNKLNGWQRLWLLCVAIYAIPVVIFTYTAIPETPTSSEILHDPNYINADVATKAATFFKYIGNDPNYTSANEATKAAIRERFGIAGSQPITTEAGSIDIQGKSRLKIIALGFLAWALPSIAIFLFGIAIRWVYVGFTQNSG